MANTSTQSSVCKARLYKICREVLKGNQKIASIVVLLQRHYHVLPFSL